jgi:hypothetical protein
MNAARRQFDHEAQLRSYERRSGSGARVYAYDPAKADGCVVSIRINSAYAVSKGVQGKASPEVQFDMCLIREQLRGLRSQPGLYWNGSKPDLRSWRTALVRHDGASRGGLAHAMLKGHRKAYEVARALGFGDAGPREAWRRRGSCAVVGGAPSLARAANGARIDAHDVVIRFNDHPSGGRYARSVGNRSTFRVLNSLYAALPSPDPSAQSLQVCQNGRKVLSAVERAAADGHAKRHLLDPEVYRTFYEHFGSGGLTGALGVWFALSMCESVELHGFSSPCELGTKYTHYHTAVEHMERVQVNTVKVALWTHALRCAGLVAWAPPDDGDADHWCSGP